MMQTVRLLHGRIGLALRPSSLIGVELLCVAAADWLFWDAWPGLSLPLFCATLLVSTSVNQPVRATRLRSAWLILAFSVIPAVEDLGLISALIAVAGTSCATGLLVTRGAGSWGRRFAATSLRPISGVWRIPGDITRCQRSARIRRRSRKPGKTGWLSWIIPFAMLSLFAALLAAANPIIASWFAALPLQSWPDVSFGRVSFWTAMMVVVWPFARARRPHFAKAGQKPSGPESQQALPQDSVAAALFGETALRRTLVLCNLLFALQGTLDGFYLWGGMTLPQGMSYATYAHRGAYPLVATALLAGASVLLARRLAAERKTPRSLIGLILLFTSQNVMLVVSAMRRLELYVEAYGLTEWRLAALVWMGLVGLGLFLIIVQIARERNNTWLLTRAMLATVALLYAWCLADVPALIASFNVAHSSEVGGAGPNLDRGALLHLGPDALPALDRYLALGNDEPMRGFMQSIRDAWACRLRQEAGQWRRWSVRAWRLRRYLATLGETGPVPEFCPDADAQD